MRIEGNDQRLAAATAIQMQQTGVQLMLAPKTAQLQDAQKADKENTVQSIAGDKVSIRVELPQKRSTRCKKWATSQISSIRWLPIFDRPMRAYGCQCYYRTDEGVFRQDYQELPPFPPESKERMEQLMKYSSLQKQILSLMIPPPPQPTYEKVKHLWEGLTSGLGSSIQTPSLPQGCP